jgi:Mg2+ and Co2+ transporter CorA
MRTVYPSEGKPVWIDLWNPTREEISQACTDFRLNVPPHEQLEEIEFSSRLQYEDGTFYHLGSSDAPS